MAKKDKSYYWEVIVPEPFVIDAKVTDEQFISSMVSASRQSDVTEIIRQFLQMPTKTLITYCKESELKDLFCYEHQDYKCKLEKHENGWMLSVLSKDDEFIGRGEIYKLGDKITKDKIQPALQLHMIDFVNRYEKGNDRIKSLMCKMEILKNKIKTSNVLS